MSDAPLFDVRRVAWYICVVIAGFEGVFRPGAAGENTYG